MNAFKPSMSPLQVDADTRLEATDEMLSALFDGEADAAALDAVLAAHEDGAAFSRWHAYSVIGPALRGELPAPGQRSTMSFLASVRQGIREDVAPEVTRADVAVVQPRVAEAANDAVFRWKLVAGFASVAAVVAVSWSVLSGQAGGPAAAGPQWAQAEPQGSVPVLVNTPQGAIVRDARLEQLMAQHRQHGGMSALQEPAGFLRNATFDSEGR